MKNHQRLIKNNNTQLQMIHPEIKEQITKLQSNDFIDFSPTKSHRPQAITQSKQQEISHTKNKIDNLIEQLNEKLVDHFQKKEKQLIEQYRQQLLNAQRQLNNLKAFTSQQQIRNKMIKKKKQLEKERHTLIQANMHFSNKCQVYKKTLTNLIMQGKQMQKEVAFLQQRLKIANKKRLQLLEDVEKTPAISSRIEYKSQQPLFSTISKLKKLNQQGTPPPILHKSVSKKDIPDTKDRTAHDQSKVKFTKSISLKSQPKITKMITFGNKSQSEQTQNARINASMSKTINKSPIQKIFEQVVEQVRQKRKKKKMMPLIKGQEFTEYEKKQIMEIFLEKEEVKRKIYEQIFVKNNNEQSKKEKKAKIHLEDIEY